MAEHAELLSSAGELLGTRLTAPEDLGGSNRSVVLRVRREDGGTVIVKAYDRTNTEALQCFTAEAAGLAFSKEGPELLAADTDRVMMVMADLGAWPSLADVLLGDDPAEATRTLQAWARAYGRMAHDSLNRADELTGFLKTYSVGEPSWNDSTWIADELPKYRETLAGMGIAVSPGLDRELQGLTALVGAGPRVFSPGDICPDNNLLTDDGFRVIDFEGSGYHSAYLDAAYVTMPFATCWCVYRLPKDVADEVLDVYWTEVTGNAPTDADLAGIRLAVAAWTFNMTQFLLPDALNEDRPMHRTRRPIATRRQVLRHRVRTLRDLLTEYDELPAVRQACEDMLALSDGWGTPELELYPAYRRA